MTDRNRTILSKAGFTLLELLVVVAVIGFLSSISIVALSASQRHSRDTQRQLDQISIMKAVELYVADNGTVPAQLKSVAIPARSLAQSKGLWSFMDRLIPPARAEHCLDGQVHMIKLLGDSSPCGDDPGGGGAGGGGGGGAGPVCGDGVLDAGEQCDEGAGNGACPATCSTSCTTNSCPQGGPSCGNAICESGETVGSCPADCNSAGGGAPQSCGNAVCNAGETPGNCVQDCPNYSVCYVSGEWDLCCLLGGDRCQGQQGTGGYYSVCAGRQCVQRYFLQPPAYTCQGDSDCTPSAGGSGNENKMVPDTAGSQWLAGLTRYMASIPKDPGHKQDPGGDAAVTEKLNSYWASSHPDVVKQHRFCVYVAYEGTERVWPYNDINDTPTGPLDTRWSVLCLD